VRYKEGHVCSAAEAAALQKTYERNLKPAFKTIIAKAIAADQNIEDIENAATACATRYQFGNRGGALRKPKDPVAVKAFEIASLHVRESLRAAGANLKQVNPSTIAKRAKQWVDDPARGYLALARKALVEARGREIDLTEFLL
jgi:hypothetical protein